MIHLPNLKKKNTWVKGKEKGKLKIHSKPLNLIESNNGQCLITCAFGVADRREFHAPQILQQKVQLFCGF